MDTLTESSEVDSTHTFFCTGEHDEWAPWSFVNSHGDRISVRLRVAPISPDLGIQVWLESPRHVVVEFSYPGFRMKVNELLEQYHREMDHIEACRQATHYFWEMIFEAAILRLFPS